MSPFINHSFGFVFFFLNASFASPCYIDNTVDIPVTTRRILWGKLINAGQTCIAPDYILCTKEVQGKFLAEAKLVLNEWYGQNTRDSPDLCRIINQANFQ